MLKQTFIQASAVMLTSRVGPDRTSTIMQTSIQRTHIHTGQPPRVAYRLAPA